MKRDKQFEAWARPILLKAQKKLLVEEFVPLELVPSDEHPQLAFGLCYPYKDAKVYYGPDAIRIFKQRRFEYLKKALVHEICHALTDPIYCKAGSRYISKDELEDERERLTDHLANLIIKNKLL